MSVDGSRRADWEAMQSKNSKQLASDAANRTLYGGGGGGGGPMDPITPKDYIDAKCSELRAESRADLVEIKAIIETKLDSLPTYRQFLAGLGGAVVAIVGLILAVLAYSGERSDSATGLGASLQRLQSTADANSSAIMEMQKVPPNPASNN